MSPIKEGILLTNRFQVEKEIGQGDWTEIFRCFDITRNEYCVLKVLHADAPDNRIRRFKQEFIALHHNEHPSIVKVFDLWDDPGTGLCFTAEYVEGTPVTKLFRKCEPAIMINLMIRTCQIIKYLHSKNIIHADLKPTSLLVSTASAAESPEDRPAKGRTTSPPLDKQRPDRARKPASAQEFRITLTGLGLMEQIPFFRDTMMRESFYYIAPEVALGRNYDATADIYSLGVLFYELSTGELPFHGDSLITLVKNKLRMEPLNPREINKTIPSRLEQIILRALKRRISDRYDIIEQIIFDLKTVEQELLSSPVPERRKTYFLSSSIVSRETEISTVTKAIDQLENEKGAIVCIAGEKQSGKTRFAQEIKLLAQLKGINTFTSICNPRFSYPLQPIVELIQQSIQQMQQRFPGPVDAYIDEQDSDNSPLDSEQQADQEEVAKSTITTGNTIERERSEAIDSAIKLFLSFAMEIPLVLIIDDVHLADQETIEFLLRLSEKIENYPLLLYILYRNDVISVETESGSADKPRSLIDITSEDIGPVKNLKLLRLNEDQTKEFVLSVLETKNISPLFSGFIYHQTEGLPGLIITFINYLIEQGILIQDEKGNWKNPDVNQAAISTQAPIKPDLRKNVSGLSNDELKILRYIAIIRKEVDCATLAEWIDVSPDRLQTHLHSLEKHFLVRVTRTTSRPLYRIWHTQHGKAILDASSEEEISLLHGKLASSLDKKYAEGKQDLVSDIAYHLARSNAPRQKKITYSLFAADKARKEGQIGLVLQHFEDIKSYLRDISLDDISVFGKKILLEPGKLYYQTGEYKTALDWFKSILPHFEQDQDMEVLAELYHLLGTVYLHISFYDRALHFLHSGIAKLANFDQSPLLALIYAQVAHCYFFTGQIDKALENSTRSIKLAEHSDDINRVSEIYLYNGLLLLFMDNHTEAFPYLLRSLKLKELVNDEQGRARVLTGLGRVFHLQGNQSKARQSFQEARTLFRRGYNPVDPQLLLLYYADFHFHFSVNWKKSLELLVEIEENEVSLKNPYLLGLAVLKIGDIYSEQGTHEKAINAYQKSLEIFSKMKIPVGEAESYAAFGRWYLLQGDLVQAEDFLSKSMRLFDSLGLDLKYSKIQIHFSHLMLKKKEYVRAKTLLLDILDNMQEQDYAYDRGIALRLLAVASLSLGNLEKAVLNLDESERLLKKIDAEYELARTYYEKGKIFLQSDKTSLGNRYSQRALTILKKIGAVPLYQQLENEILGFKDATLPYLYGIEEKKGEMATLYQMSQIITSILDLRDLSERLMDMVIESVKAERGLLILCDRFSDEIQIKVAKNFHQDKLEHIEDFSRKVVDEVLKTHKPVLTGDVIGDKRFRMNLSVALFDIHSVLCIPLITRNRIIGVIYVDSKDPKNIFTEREANFLVALANHATVALENALLYQNTRSILEGLRDGIMTIDRKGNLLTLNRKAEKILNLSDSSVSGHHFRDILAGTSAEELNNLIVRTLQNKQNCEKEISFVEENKDRIDLSVTTSVTTDGYGELTGAIVLLRDISLIKKMQEELELQLRLSAMGELAAKVSHRMKNLLSGIKILTQGLERECHDDPEQQKTVNHMLLQVEDAEKYIYQMLNPAPYAGYTTLSITFERLIEKTLAHIKPLLIQKKIEIFKNIEHELPQLKINENLLVETMINLCLNAVEAMDTGGTLSINVCSKLKPDPPKPDSPEQDDNNQEGIILEISDTGQGIPEEFRDKIFEPFFTTKSKGSGVGLWLVHNLITNYKGRIELSSTLGKGTTFRLFLPA